jgi:hypothetical protein
MSDLQLAARAAIAAVASVIGTGLLLSALVGCAATFACKSDVRVELHDKSVVVKCIDGSAPTVTVTASKVVGP